MGRIVILGAGVMGSAMALPASHGGHEIHLVGTPLDEAVIRSVSGNGFHPRLGVALPDGVRAHPWTELGAVMAGGADLVVLGVSSAGVGWATDRLAEVVSAPVPILMITKGLVPRDGGLGLLPEQVARDLEARTGVRCPVMAVAGPCIAGELAVRRDTSVVVTGHDLDAVAAALRLLEAPFYHAGTSPDLPGVELCAAFKNFYALAVGAAAGQLDRQGRAANGALLHNVAASTFTQALAELALLVEHQGGRRETVYGPAGVGDLYVTCQAGRNSRMGRHLGTGLPYSRAKAEQMPEDTVEGAQLALDLGPTLDALLHQGRLDAARMPLTVAILDAVCRDRPLALDPARFGSDEAPGRKDA